jgi:hypothetical protein
MKTVVICFASISYLLISGKSYDPMTHLQAIHMILFGGIAKELYACFELIFGKVDNS